MPRDGGNQTGMDGPSPALPSPCCGGRKEGEAGKGGLLGGGLDLEGRLTLRKAAGLGSGPPPVRITFTVDPRAGAGDRARWTRGGEEAGLPRAPSAVTTADASREAFPPTLTFKIGLQFAFPPSVPILISTARNYLPTPQL